MIIYKTTNLINRKIYIGKDEREFKNYLGSGLHLKRAIKKYGKENFKKEILEHCDSHEQVCEREKFWIKELDARNPEIGYNICEGGEGVVGLKRSNEWKKQKSQKMKNNKNAIGSTHTEKWKLEKSIDMKSKKNALGSKRNSEQNIKNSERMKNNKYRRKPILQFSLNNQFIKEWECGEYAVNELKINGGHISQVCNEKRKSAGGFIWKFKERK